MTDHRSSAPPHAARGFRRLVVPTDFGEAAIHSVDAALVLAKQLDAEVILLHVFHVPAVAYASGAEVPYEELRAGAAEALGLAAAKMKERHSRTVAEQVEGEPWQEILAAAARYHADLIVMGTSAREGLPRFFLGSVAEKVLRASPVPVMIVAPHAHAPEG